MAGQEAFESLFPFANIVFFTVIFFLFVFKLYMNHKAKMYKTLEKLYEAMIALGVLQATFTRFLVDPSQDKHTFFTCEIITPASMFLPREDVEFLLEIDCKSTQEMKNFQEHIRKETLRMAVIRDKLHLKVYGRTF
ncbi:hypothetical protein EHV15_35820 [Paenibacillus oralis]|uniref:Uncharacterized protein n=1 Tax=Paenibacillus oralis TaxID=2490856 RepID=A0A3P3TA67_9BACL|nr:hypothetical protein [Paenibacillus oralis]RRJ54941.1 hypothetical protein EHV15_35820 [Paenibacillus oralis]